MKEEPKQEHRKICNCKRAYTNPLSGICSFCWNEKFPNEKDEIKEEDLLEPKQETLEEDLQICKDCGSKEVARCKWVNVNTEEIYSADSGTTLEWCFDCKSETNIIDKEDYETRNN
jgi:hypothetical protein